MIRKIYSQMESRMELLESFKESELVDEPKVVPVVNLLISDLSTLQYYMKNTELFSIKDIKVRLLDYINTYKELIISTDDVVGEIGDDLVIRLLQDSIDEYKFYRELL